MCSTNISILFFRIHTPETVFKYFFFMDIDLICCVQESVKCMRYNEILYNLRLKNKRAAFTIIYSISIETAEATGSVFMYRVGFHYI